MTQASTPDNQIILATIHSLPPDKQGWRGLDREGNHRRKWYTLLENELCLVTALLVPPGEQSIRHYHESGELNLSWPDGLPLMRWNPPKVEHGGPVAPEPGTLTETEKQMQEAEKSLSTVGDPAVANLFRSVLSDLSGFRKLVEDLTRPKPSLRVSVDVLFPPFQTTITDPLYPEHRTVTGQWYF